MISTMRWKCRTTGTVAETVVAVVVSAAVLFLHLHHMAPRDRRPPGLSVRAPSDGPPLMEKRCYKGIMTLEVLRKDVQEKGRPGC